MVPATGIMIAHLVAAQRSLYRDGFKAEANKLSPIIASMLDHEVDDPAMVSASGAGTNPTIQGCAELIEAEHHPAVSLAVRTASASSSKRPLSKAEWARIRRKIDMHPPRQKRWICCSHPEKRRTRSGETTWGTVCKYLEKSGPSKGTMMGTWIVLSRDANSKPRSITISGKRMKFCTTSPNP